MLNKTYPKIVVLFFLFLLNNCSNSSENQNAVSPEITNDITQESITAFYGGGIMYKEDHRAAVIEELKNAGLETIIVWTIHINEKGDLNFNAEFPLVENGQYIGAATHPNFAADMANLKTAPTSINRIEFGLAAAGSGTFNHVKTFYETEGFGPGTTLYKNFKALQEAIPQIDAFNNDDEVTYDAESAIAFTKMLAGMGFKNAIVPYERQAFWKALVDGVNAEFPENIDRNYLQCYAGGSRNNPCSNSWDFGIPMIPGLWGGPNGIPAESVAEQMQKWQDQCSIAGGFIWDYEKFALTPEVKKYVEALE